MKFVNVIFDKISCLEYIIFKKSVFAIVIFFWLIIQFVIVYYCHALDIAGDTGLYQYYAQKCVEHGTIYPDYSNYHNQYIFNPGWVNFILLWIKVFGNANLLYYFNIVWNSIILLYTYKLSYRITSSVKIATMASYFFIILPSFLTITTDLFSELFFVSFIMASAYHALDKNIKGIFASGFFIAIAYWTRPLAIAWFISYYCYYWLCNKRKSAYICLTSSVIIALMVIACLTRINFPNYIFSASTGGVNLIQGANDKATGAYCIEARQKGGLGYLPGLYSNDSVPVKIIHGEGTWEHAENGRRYMQSFSDKYSYRECDSIWKARSIEWIKQNPMKWVSLIPKKIVFLWWDGAVFNASCVYPNRYVRKIYSIIDKYNTPYSRFLFLTGIISLTTILWRKKEYIFIGIPIIVASGMTVATVGMYRYNMIMLPYLCIISVLFLYHIKRFFYDSIYKRYNQID